LICWVIIRLSKKYPSTLSVLSILVWPLLPIDCRSGGFLLHLITLTNTKSVRLLWTKDRPVAEIPTWQHSQEIYIHAHGKIRARNPSKRATADHALDRAINGIGKIVYSVLRTVYTVLN
jgi:hypothetical protein